MKIIKGLLVLCFFSALLGSCFDPPEFPVTPKIEFEKIEFYDNPSGADSLVLYIEFQDGDGDLGLPAGQLEYISDPYHNINYYQTNNGELVEVKTLAGVIGRDTLQLLDIPNPAQGKLVFPRTRKQAQYSGLPAYNCSDYEFAREANLIIREEDINALDDFTNITDTINISGFRFYQIEDTLYYRVNPNHYNIEVDFFIADPNANNPEEPGFREFDWRKEFCTQSFDGRFPVLSDQPTALEGTLRYRMISLGFVNIFSINTMKLKVRIRDRSLNVSNTVSTGEFTLDKIKVR